MSDTPTPSSPAPEADLRSEAGSLRSPGEHDDLLVLIGMNAWLKHRGLPPLGITMDNPALRADVLAIQAATLAALSPPRMAEPTALRRDEGEEERDRHEPVPKSEWEELLAEVASLSAWREAVIDALVVAGIYRAEYETNPRKALNDLLAWEGNVALDPKVSAESRARLAEARREGWEQGVRATLRQSRLGLYSSALNPDAMEDGFIAEILAALRARASDEHSESPTEGAP